MGAVGGAPRGQAASGLDASRWTAHAWHDETAGANCGLRPLSRVVAGCCSRLCQTADSAVAARGANRHVGSGSINRSAVCGQTVGLDRLQMHRLPARSPYDLDGSRAGDMADLRDRGRRPACGDAMRKRRSGAGGRVGAASRRSHRPGRRREPGRCGVDIRYDRPSSGRGLSAIARASSAAPLRPTELERGEVEDEQRSQRNDQGPQRVHSIFPRDSADAVTGSSSSTDRRDIVR